MKRAGEHYANEQRGSTVHVTPGNPVTKCVPKASDGVKKPDSADTSPLNNRDTEDTAATAVNA